MLVFVQMDATKLVGSLRKIGPRGATDIQDREEMAKSLEEEFPAQAMASFE